MEKQKLKDFLKNKNYLNYSEKLRNKFLKGIIITLKEQKERIICENKKDLDEFIKLNKKVSKRLVLDEKKITDLIKGIELLIKIKDPLGETLLKRQLDKDLILRKVSVPLGTVLVIFEARPDALIQIFSLMIKTNNTLIIKGGSEAKHTNKFVFNLIYKVGLKLGYNKNFSYLVTEKDEIKSLIKLNNDIDLVIPRGSNKLVEYIMNNSKIPVLGHSDGICSIYVDSKIDIKKAIKIILDAKTNYPEACNSLEKIIINKKLTKTLQNQILDSLIENNIKVLYPKNEKDFKVEFLDLRVNIVYVNDVKEAITHINKYGSKHTDSIISNDKKNIEYFVNNVDSANVFINTSTRFSDGYRYGFGAEVGISTSKIHARGPVGLFGLVTTKYILESKVNKDAVVNDYMSNKKNFDFKDL